MTRLELYVAINAALKEAHDVAKLLGDTYLVGEIKIIADSNNEAMCDDIRWGHHRREVAS